MRLEHARRASRYADELGSAPAGKDGHMHPNRIFAALRAVLNSDAITIADGGDILSFARLGLAAPRTYLDAGTFGCLGVGTPFGVAAALLHPDRQVVVVSGDGAFGINGMEIDSAKRHGAKVVFVVANNAAWNIERLDQEMNFGGRIVGTRLAWSDYAAMARALADGGEFRFVSDIDDYAAWTLMHFQHADDITWSAESADDWRKPWPGYTMTRYGQKAVREGRKATYLIFRRRARN